MILKNLSVSAFGRYGTIIEHDITNTDQFQLVVEEPEAAGWRIAVSRLKRSSIDKLGLHPYSRESFEPLQGSSVLFVATREQPDVIEAFLLDQPVCLHKDVWHAAAALSEQATIKITENYAMSALEYRLSAPLGIGIISSDMNSEKR